MQAHYVVLDNPLPEHIYDALIVRIPVEKRMQISKFHSRTEKRFAFWRNFSSVFGPVRN